MARIWTKLFLVSVLISLEQAVAEAKRGGGDSSSDGDSGSSDSNDGDGDGGGSSGADLGVRHVSYDAPRWPYRWPGSYYNGSVTLEAAILQWSGCNSPSRSPVRTNFDGILHVGPVDDEMSYDDISPRFTLVAWDAGTEPTSNWTDAENYGSYGPDRWLLFSPDARIMSSRYRDNWATTTSNNQPRDSGWDLSLQPGDGSGTFLMNGTSLNGGNGIPAWDVRKKSFNEWFNITAPTCDGAPGFLMMNLITTAVADRIAGTNIGESMRNTTMQGSFSASEATFTWTGSFIGGFVSNPAAGAEYLQETDPIGVFNITFQGTLDDSQSDSLSQRAAPLTGYPQTANGPDWIVSKDRDDNVPQQKIWYQESSANRLGGGAASLWVLASLTCIAACAV